MKQWIFASAISVGLVPVQAFSQAYFQESFESGANPFSFASYNDYYDDVVGSPAMTGERVQDGERGQVWKTTFKDFRNDTYFGHRIEQPASWGIGNRIHWAGYVKFGDTPNSDEWATVDGHDAMGKRSYELKFPDIFPGNPAWQSSRIIGKMRAGSGPNRGTFVVYTPDGQNHSAQDRGFPEFESGRWYAIEFMVEDKGSDDTVKIWINNSDESRPDYVHTGGDMFSSAYWRPGLRYDHGYRNHNVGRPTTFYYDQITIADSFIGLTPPGGAANSVAPAAPGSLQVAD